MRNVRSKSQLLRSAAQIAKELQKLQQSRLTEQTKISEIKEAERPLGVRLKSVRDELTSLERGAWTKWVREDSGLDPQFVWRVLRESDAKALQKRRDESNRAAKARVRSHRLFTDPMVEPPAKDLPKIRGRVEDALRDPATALRLDQLLTHLTEFQS